MKITKNPKFPNLSGVRKSLVDFRIKIDFSVFKNRKVRVNLLSDMCGQSTNFPDKAGSARYGALFPINESWR